MSSGARGRMSGKEYEEALKQFIETARSDVHAAILALVRATSPCGGTKGGAAGLELLEATGYSKPVVVEKLAVALTQHLKGR
ncbi:hypothetical protein EON66_08175 [archaeon]|nr:MAG: hypothetical protein EON66_08175 [archaeon]